MAHPLSPAQVEQLKRDAKRLARDTNIPLFQAQQQLACAKGYKNWSLLAQHTRRVSAAASKAPGPISPLLDAKNSIVAQAEKIVDRYYLHGDQVDRKPTQFYCGHCDLFVEAGHFFGTHDRQETLERCLRELTRWPASPLATMGRRPTDASNLLEGPSRTMAAAREKARGAFHRWLEGHKGKDTITGDLARDALADKTFPTSATTLTEVAEYFDRRRVSSDVIKALKRAWRQFEATLHN